MPDYSLKVIEELQATYQLVGMKKTIAALQQARLSGDHVQLHINFVSELICGHFNTTIEKVREGKEKQDIVTYTKGFIVYYLRKEFDINWKELKQMLDTDQTWLFRCGKLIKQLDPRLEPHKPYCIKKDFFDQKIKAYQKQLKK